MRKMLNASCVGWVWIFLVTVPSALGAEAGLAPCEFSRPAFQRPPVECSSRPLWFWNKPNVTPDELREIVTRSFHESRYYGFGILPWDDRNVYLTDTFFDRYRVTVETAARLGMKLCLYDEYAFPSGTAGGQFARRFPELTMKRLDMHVREVRGPVRLEASIPTGTLMGVVAMENATKQRIDISSCTQGGSRLVWDAPAGDWRVMIFVCVRQGPFKHDHPGLKGLELMDYLDRRATEAFLKIVHEEYYKRFEKYFGTTIDSVFYDEPTLYWTDGGRTWTDGFNRAFQARHGFSPVPYYPALWCDIGPETSAARNLLFGLRAELFATEYIKVMNDWCTAHRLKLTGHMDQEQIDNVTSISGDLLLAFKYQEIPGIDEIFTFGRTQRAYKLISSAAYNWDRPLVMCETYGAIDKMPVSMLYRMAMDLYAKGINFMVPHAVWTDPAKIVFPPELSWRHPQYGPALPAYNEYIGRLNMMLQGGRHVADIGVFYPIATLQGGYRFESGAPNTGGAPLPEVDFMNVGEVLSLQVRRDFTYLHPDTLDERCEVKGRTLCLGNRVNHEEYRLLLMPGMKVIGWANLQKIKAFHDAGGSVIATTQLPYQSAERDKDAEVRETIRKMFGIDPVSLQPLKADASRGGEKRGRARFIGRCDPSSLRAVVDEAIAVPDVAFTDSVEVRGGNLTYIHKVKQGQDIYFFANSSETAVHPKIRLRGKLRLERWDPHTGEITGPACVSERCGEQDVTVFSLDLPGHRSVFIVGEP